MTRLELATADDGRWFRPGAEIQGTATWRLDLAPDSLEIRLFWYTAGKGTRNVEVVGSVSIETPGNDGRRDFRLRVPEGPYAFTGRLVTLAWAIELVALPSEDTTRLDLVIGPQPVEIDIREPRIDPSLK
jgi:hypothetical protein